MSKFIINKTAAEQIVKHGSSSPQAHFYGVPSVDYQHKYKKQSDDINDSAASPFSWCRVYQNGDKLKDGSENKDKWKKTSIGIFVNTGYELDSTGKEETGETFKVYSTNTYERNIADYHSNEMASRLKNVDKEFSNGTTEPGLNDLSTQRYFVINVSGKWFIFARMDWKYLDVTFPWMLYPVSQSEIDE